jgi:UDP-GlcNAc3NAcA epimerase
LQPIKIVTVVGARPQFVKAATVSRVIARHSQVREVLVHTGQHFDENMSAVFFAEMEISPPAHYLGVNGGGHGEQTGRMLEAIEQVLAIETPDVLMVYGDTNSTLAGALAAAKLHILVAHVEAGLRSFNRRMPEEINRVLTDHISEVLFAPTDQAVTNLLKEGIAKDRIYHVGDVMYDAALYFAPRADLESHILKSLGLAPGMYILATVHRAENTDEAERLHAVVDGLCTVARSIPVVLPLHPRAAAALVRENLYERATAQLRLIDPVGYLDMVMLTKNARLVATDSGGLQKEAFFYRVPCVTMRDETEWIELVDLGWNHVAPPTDADSVADAIRARLGVQGRAAQPYGNGNAADEILRVLLETTLDRLGARKTDEGPKIEV